MINIPYINLYIFLVGLGATWKFEFGGDLYATDLLLAGSLLYFLERARRFLLHGLIGILLLLGALWLVNLIVTDVYRGTPFEDWSRGWAKIAFLLIDFCGIIVLTKLRYERIIWFVAGTTCALLLQALFFPNQYQSTESESWKFGIGVACTTFAALFGASALARRLLGPVGEFIPLALLGIVSLALDARSLFGTAIAAVAFGITKKMISLSPQLQARIKPAVFSVLLVGGLVVSQGLIATYEIAADGGWLGEEAKRKYETQASGSIHLLIGGRAESLVSTTAIGDSPIVGHGSWAKDVAYVALLINILESKGLNVAGDPYLSPLIPTHSHLFGAWVEAGIMGGVFWIVVLVIAIAAFYRCLKREDVPGTLTAYILISLVWVILFSPLGAQARFQTSAMICVALSVLLPPRRTPLRLASLK